MKTVEALNGGLGGRREDTGGIMAEWESMGPSSLEDLIQYFAQEWMEKGWHEHYFVCVRQPVVQEGNVEIVSAKTQKCWEWPQKTAGEVLVWLFVGLVHEDQLDEADGILQVMLNAE